MRSRRIAPRDAVIVSTQPFETPRTEDRPQTLAQRRKDFEQAHKVWIEAQNTRFEKDGLWCDDFRVW